MYMLKFIILWPKEIDYVSKHLGKQTSIMISGVGMLTFGDDTIFCGRPCNLNLKLV